jgi:hypothetical protein
MQQVLYPRANTQPLTDDVEAIGEEPAALRIRAIHEAETAIRELARSYPLPADSYLALALQGLQAEQFIASAFVYSLISQLNSMNGGDGAGLFSGIERYDMLLKRLEIVANQYQTSMFTLYAALLRQLGIEESLPKMTDILWRYAALPRTVQQSVIATLGADRQAVVTIARAWFEDERARRRGRKEQEEWGLFEETDYYDPTGKVAGTSLTFAEAAIPWVSSNTFRHTVFRETLCNHLLEALEFGSLAEVVSRKALPHYVIQLLSNGGNVKANAKAPDYSNAINLAVMGLFPSLELLSGCLPTHMMGEGALSVADWTLCLQNNENTAPLGYISDVDAASMLTIETHTRHTPPGMGNDKESGQMLFSHTVMKPGCQVLFEFSVAPFASHLAKGAAYFAYRSWLAAGGQVGGHDNIGEGRFRLVEQRGVEEELERAAVDYQRYVDQHRDALYEALATGTMGWKERLPAWG